MRARVGAVVRIFAILLCVSLPLRGDASQTGERDLFQRIFSPCCYRETLDIHQSPIADEPDRDPRAAGARRLPRQHPRRHGLALRRERPDQAAANGHRAGDLRGHGVARRTAHRSRAPALPARSSPARASQGPRPSGRGRRAAGGSIGRRASGASTERRGSFTLSSLRVGHGSRRVQPAIRAR